MKMTFLGTAAATACPLVFCRCEACRRAGKERGKDMRRRSSALVGSDMLIDLGPDVMSAAFAFGADVSRVRYLLQTHTHSDHFDAGHLVTRIAEYATRDALPLEVCASPQALEHMSEKLAREEDGATLLDSVWQKRLNVRVRAMRHGDSVVLGGRRVMAIDSDHDPSDGSLLYAVEEGDRALLYATDTPEIPERSWALLRDRKLRFDAVAIDCTYGPGTEGGGHLNADGAARAVARMRCEGILKEDG